MAVKKKPTCLVVQGFGEKADLRTGRTLNLDASYRVVREAVMEAGLTCLRADELVHPGTIEAALYEWLSRADLVIADLSTYNLSAAYELGIRHALRRGRTIVVAESECRSPFGLVSLPVLTYHHLGRDIGRSEQERFKTLLVSRIQTVMAAEEAGDSPLYARLPLTPPVDTRPAEPEPQPDAPAVQPTAPAPPNIEEQSAKDLLDSGRAALDHISFWEAKMYFRALQQLRPNDESIVHHLAVVTYRSRLPDARSSLEQARDLLTRLEPGTTNNPETLQVWGAVHRRLWELCDDAAALDVAIEAYQRSFFVRQHYAAACEAAHLFDVRAARRRQEDGGRHEAIADAVMARRLRRAVLAMAPKDADAGTESPSERYWLRASLWEAAVGLKDLGSQERWRQEAEVAAVSRWRIAVTRARLKRIESGLERSPLDSLTPLAADDAGAAPAKDVGAKPPPSEGAA